MKKRIAVSRFALFLYLVILFQLTLFGRKECDPLSDVFGGWIPFYQYWHWNFDALYNIFLLTPLLFLLLWNFPKMSDGNQKRLMIRCSVISFCMSFFIEINQLIFHIGTFQIADLVYNTISGMIGGLIYRKVIKKIRKLQTEDR